MNDDLLLLPLFFGVVMAVVTVAGLLLMRFRPAAEAGTDAASDPETSGAGGGGEWQQLATAALSRIGVWVARHGSRTDSLRKQLFRAGYRTAPAVEIFCGIQVSFALLLAVVVAWTVAASKGGFGAAFVPAVCGAGFGYLLPVRLLEYQVRSRAQRIRVAVPPALDLLVLALEAGQPLDQAMCDTSISLRAVFPDLSSELLFTHLEMRAGTARQEALRHLAERSGEEEMRKLAFLLIDGERFGTSLGPALRTHGRYLRTRMRQSAQEIARKLTVKLVLPVFFLIFPSVLLVTLGPAYLQMRQFLDSFLR